MKKETLAAIAAVSLLVVGAPAQAAHIYETTLKGSYVFPPTDSPATGHASVMLDGTTLTINLTFSGLTGGGVTGAHIHCCAPAYAFPGLSTEDHNAPMVIDFDSPFPYGAISGTYSDVFNLETDLIGLSVAEFTSRLPHSNVYIDLHNPGFPSAEIRGQVSPEPGTWAMLACGLLALWAGRVRVRR